MIPKSTMMPYIKEAFVGSRPPYKIYITISTGVLFWYVTSNHNIFKKLAPFICAQFNIKFKAYVPATVIVGDKLLSVHPYISKIFFRFMSANNCSHKFALPDITHIWRTNWITSGHEKHYVNGISDRWSCING